MRYLLDTHTLIWSGSKSARLSQRVRAILADPGVQLFVSAATSWEMAMKYRAGRLPQVADLLVDLENQLARQGFTILPITSPQARLAGSLPGKHGDPLDRILAAQAILEDLTLLSVDPKLDGFGARRLWQ